MIPASDLTNAALEPILPHGTVPSQKLVLHSNGLTFVLVGTDSDPGTFDNGWLALGLWNPISKSWSLAGIHEGYNGITTLLRQGPSLGQTDTVYASFAMGATGQSTTNLILGISTNGVKILRKLPVLPPNNATLQNGKLVITAGNYQESDWWSGGKWTYQITPIKQLLDEADVHVSYVEQPGHGDLMNVIGNNVVNIKVGQTVSFIPANSAAWSSINSTQIYANGGSGPVQFASASMLNGNTTPAFDQAGTYRFAITPPGSEPMSLNSDMAQVTVIVSK